MNKSDHQKQDYWSQRRGRIKSSVGQWHAGKGVTLRGRSLLGELLDELSHMQLLVFSYSGRLIAKPLADWLEKTRFLMAYPDSRIWCNYLPSLVASQGVSPVTAGVLSYLAADSKAYGSQVQANIVTTLIQLFKAHQHNQDFAELVAAFPLRMGAPSIPGFLRPVRVADERLQPMREISNKLGFTPGPYVQFVEAFSEYLEEHCHCGLNSAGYCCAFLLDQGFDADFVFLICVSAVESGALACYHNHRNDQVGGFLPLHCDDVNYTGPKLRNLVSLYP